MNEVWLIAAGLLISGVMGLLKKPFAWLRRQHDIVKALIVLALAAALYFGLKLAGIEGTGTEIPVAALVAMGIKAVADSLKNVMNEPPEEKAKRLSQ